MCYFQVCNVDVLIASCPFDFVCLRSACMTIRFRSATYPPIDVAPFGLNMNELDIYIYRIPVILELKCITFLTCSGL